SLLDLPARCGHLARCLSHLFVQMCCLAWYDPYHSIIAGYKHSADGIREALDKVTGEIVSANQSMAFAANWLVFAAKLDSRGRQCIWGYHLRSRQHAGVGEGEHER